VGGIRRRWHAVLLCVTGGLVYGVIRFSRPAPPYATAERGDVTQTVQAAGLLQPKLKVDIGAQVSGQVLKLHMQLG